MASNAPPPRRSEEIAAHDDAEFGTMRLIKDIFHSKPPGGAPWCEHVMYHWEGAVSGVALAINVEAEGAFPDVPAAARALILGHIRDSAALMNQIAPGMLDTAKDWADAGELPEPTLESFQAAFTLANVSTYDDWAPTFFFEEKVSDAGHAIFAGHVIEVQFDAAGTVLSAHLAG